MNKGELVEKIASKTLSTQSEVETTINTLIEVIRATVKKGDDVKLIGLGTFMKYKRKARKGRNPQTGAAIQIPAMWLPKFKAGRDFKLEVK